MLTDLEAAWDVHDATPAGCRLRALPIGQVRREPWAITARPARRAAHASQGASASAFDRASAKTVFVRG